MPTKLAGSKTEQLGLGLEQGQTGKVEEGIELESTPCENAGSYKENVRGGYDASDTKRSRSPPLDEVEEKQNPKGARAGTLHHEDESIFTTAVETVMLKCT